MLDAIRARVAPAFIVGLRLVVDEQLDNGITREVGLEIARRMVATGQVDFLNVIRGHIDTDAALTDVIPVQGMAASPHLDFAGEVRAETRFPVFHAARIADIATARHAVRSGKLDMVGMTRAHIADPLIVEKLEHGREADIRPCVGATYCLDRIYLAGEALCIHNPASGREATMPHEITERSAKTKKVVVVGAGPAGLEAARVAAARGHRVVIFEATPKPGGQVHLLTRSPRRRELIGIVDWRVEQCRRHGVEFRFNIYAERDEVLAENPDIVIVATGGIPDTELLASGNEFAVSARQAVTCCCTTTAPTIPACRPPKSSPPAARRSSTSPRNARSRPMSAGSISPLTCASYCRATCASPFAGARSRQAARAIRFGSGWAVITAIFSANAWSINW